MSTAHEVSEATWEGQNVRVAEVERALSRLLAELNPRGEHEEPHPPMRASVVNLIVRTADSAPLALPVVRRIGESHPARTLVVTPGPADADAALDVRITAHCHHLPNTRARICFETLELTPRGATSDHLASVVAPLLIPDLPVALWWLGALPRPDEDLLGLCDQVMVDSREAGLGALVRFSTALGERARVIDLAWTALGPWREALAGLFDPPEARAVQRELRAVEMEHVPGRAPTGMFLLLGWLASNLGWQLEGSAGPDGTGLRLHAADGPVRVSARAVPATKGLQAGELRSVTLRGGAPDRVASFNVTRHGDGKTGTTRFQLGDQLPVERVFRLPAPSPAELLGRELDRMAADPLYPPAAASGSAIATVWRLPGS